MDSKEQKFIDPKCDWGFKKIFGTDENKQNLVNFLNAFFTEVGMRRITDVAFTNKEKQGVTKDEKTVLLDVICQTDNGDTFIVEMQRYRQSDLVDRIIYYLENSATHLPKGYSMVNGIKVNYDLTPTYIIVILDFNYWPGDEAVNSFVWKHKYKNLEMSDKRGIHYLELKKFPQKPMELRNLLEKWVYLLNNLTGMTTRPDVLDDEEFDLALSAAEYASLSQEDRQIYNQEIMNELDYQGALDYAKKQGLEEQMLVSLRVMIARNVPEEDIRAILNVSNERLEELKKLI